MQRKTLRRGLLALWLSILTVAAVLAWLLVAMSQQGAEAQITRAQVRTSASCEALQAGLQRLTVLQPSSLPDGQAAASADWTAAHAVIDLALREEPGVEGGFWQAGPGVVAYGFPTYDGTGIKRDAPRAELERIEATAARAVDGRSIVTEVRPGLREAVVFTACPLSGQKAPLAAWTLQRVPTLTGDSLDQLVLAMSLLLGFVILSGGWLGWALTRWTRGLQGLVNDLQDADPTEARTVVKQLPGLADLDQVALALNGYAQRLAQARAESSRLGGELARAERMAALGGLSAGLAHEIRNPLGTMRMKVETAMAAPEGVRAARTDAALQVVLTQITRLEGLVASLLALTQPFRVERSAVVLDRWLQERRRLHADTASTQGVRLEIEADPALVAQLQGVALFDPEQMARALDNLLLNALVHVPRGGTIRLVASRTPDGSLLLRVADNGPGVPPDLRERLFEPFTTGRRDGTGLGLALVREIAQAHGGRASLRTDGPWTCFEMELPWPAS